MSPLVDLVTSGTPHLVGRPPCRELAIAEEHRIWDVYLRLDALVLQAGKGKFASNTAPINAAFHAELSRHRIAASASILAPRAPPAHCRRAHRRSTSRSLAPFLRAGRRLAGGCIARMGSESGTARCAQACSWGWYAWPCCQCNTKLAVCDASTSCPSPW